MFGNAWSKTKDPKQYKYQSVEGGSLEEVRNSYCTIHFHKIDYYEGLTKKKDA